MEMIPKIMEPKIKEIIYEQGEYPHRKKCPHCGKLIPDGSEVVLFISQKEGFYPAKGIMRFMKHHFYHRNCYLAQEYFLGKE